MSTYLKEKLTGSDRPVIQVLCKSNDNSKRRPPLILKTLIAQLLDHSDLETYQDSIAQLVTKASNRSPDSSKISMDKLWTLLQSILSILPPVMIITDALDECEPENLSRCFLIKQFLKLGVTVPGTKVIFTSRYEDPFIEMLQSQAKVEMSKENVAHDIEVVVRKAVESSPKLRILKDKIISSLLNGADGMILWAELMLATLKRARNRNAVEKMLADLPFGLNGIYKHTLIIIGRRLTDEELSLRREILGWVTTATRPMTVEELSVALAIEPGSKALDEGEIILRLENDIRELCGPMLKIMDDRTVQVVHRSVKEMLHRSAPYTNGASTIADENQKYLITLTPENEHTRLASSCITYLAYDEYRKAEFLQQILRLGDVSPIARTQPLIEYATLHWVTHLTNSGSDGMFLLNQVLEFLQSVNSYTWVQLTTAFTKREDANFSLHTLMCSKLLRWVKENGLNQADSIHILNSFLTRAVERGVELSEKEFGLDHVQTLKALLRLGCFYDHQDRLDAAMSTQQKIIHRASEATNSEVIRISQKACIELAYIYQVKGELVKSAELLEVVLEGPGRSKLVYDRYAAEAMVNLGVVYRKQGNMHKSREMAEKGIEGLEETLGSDHLLTVRYKFELCRTYFDLQMLDHAQALLDKTLKITDDVFGPEESVTLHGRDLLADILCSQGKLDEGEALLRDVLRLMIQQWGENGRSPSKVRIRLANVLFDKGEVREAISLYEQALKIYDGLLGRKHSETRGCAVKLASCYVHLDDVGSAKAVMEMYCVTAEVIKAPVRTRLERILLETSKGSKEKELLKRNDIGSDEDVSFVVV
jgi:tetratricopeptide (TPR) repeat protein